MNADQCKIMQWDDYICLAALVHPSLDHCLAHKADGGSLSL